MFARRGGSLLLQLLPDLEDEGRNRPVIDVAFRHAESLSRNPGHETRERRKASLLGMRGDPRQLQ